MTVGLGTRGDDACIWRVVGVAIEVFYDRLVLGLSGTKALQQRAHGRPIGFMQMDGIGQALLCRDK